LGSALKPYLREVTLAFEVGCMWENVARE
jgi:hypothetical protein